MNAYTKDEEVSNNSADKHERVDLGLALLHTLRIPLDPSNKEFWPFERKDLAAWCGCSSERIRQIEEQALKKMRIRLTAEGFTREEIFCALTSLAGNDRYEHRHQVHER